MALGLVDITDCQEEPFGDGYAWILARSGWLVRPLPYKGRVGLFPVEVPDDLLG